MSILTNLTFFSAFSFLFFGMSCFITAQMKAEFLKYGLSKFRMVIGGLQLLGALGLVFGYFYAPILQAAAAGGLSILMLLGFIVRLRIRDTFFQSAPSFIYAVLNAYILLLLLVTL